jgi:nitrite reductase/ring-hydroxylating ferredoxin subunit
VNRVRDLNKTPPLISFRANEVCMPTCEVCENDYDKAFEIVVDGERHIFDSFECAIHALAPVCPHCNCRIIGHGVEADGQIFCCVHCARASGTTQLKDRA